MILPNHTCSYYCHAGIHAFQLLAQPRATAAGVQVAGARFWGSLGAVQAVRQGLEADVDALACQVVAAVRTHGPMVHTTQHDPACSVAWVVFVQIAEED